MARSPLRNEPSLELDNAPAPPTIDACVICLEPVHERAVAVPCNHLNFDFLCLVSWTQNSATCPLCKSEISRIEYDWRAPDDFATYVVPHPAPAIVPSSSSSSSFSGSVSERSMRAPLHCPRRRPARRDPFATPALQPDAALERRRRVYREGLYSAHVGSNRISRYAAEVSAGALGASARLQQRARMWMRRELRAFSFLGPDALEGANREFVLEYILAVARTTDLRDPGGAARRKVADFLGEENAGLFLHELLAWLRSPFDRLEDWDRVVQYPTTAGAARNAGRRRRL